MTLKKIEHFRQPRCARSSGSAGCRVIPACVSSRYSPAFAKTGKLDSDLKPRHLAKIDRPIPFEELDQAMDKFFNVTPIGRVIVEVGQKAEPSRKKSAPLAERQIGRRSPSVRRLQRRLIRTASLFEQQSLLFGEADPTIRWGEQRILLSLIGRGAVYLEATMVPYRSRAPSDT